MNPRVSRSSALASKATGFPIAKIAARLAVGYTLQEIPNDITQATPASFEPAIDYCVVKWPRFAFEKFPGAEAGLTTHMKSVGEAMAIGRTFKQAFAKALRSRELDAEPRLAGRRAGAARALAQPRRRALRPPARGAAARRRDRRAPRRDRHRPLVPATSWPSWSPTREAPFAGGAHVQVCRHLRGRVRGPDALLLLGLGAPAARRRRATRSAAADAAERGDPRLGTEPDRPGHRVRLLLRPRRRRPSASPGATR